MNSSAEEQFVVGDLHVELHRDGGSLGDAAARYMKEAIAAAVAERGHARVVMATGNSQFPLMAALGRHDLPWDLVSVFHMDEYVGIDRDHPASFRRWIRERIQEPFVPHVVHYIEGDAEDIDGEIARYEALLRAAPIDLVCMGIGENGHLAFNEPVVADFDDERWMRLITLEETSRQQQVSEGHFGALDDVPPRALSMTIPALLAADSVIVCVPEARKAGAVLKALTGPIAANCPASILRQAPHARLLLDHDSAAQYLEARDNRFVEAGE